MTTTHKKNTPMVTQTFTLYGLLAFDVQYWNGSSWPTIPSGSVSGNNKVWRKFTFSPITTSKIRVWINQVPDSWSRVVEIQAFGTSAGGEKVQWLVPDHLGTPRIVLDQTGDRANVKRHDYLPFGEEPSISADQDFGDNKIYKSDEGEYGISFNARGFFAHAGSILESLSAESASRLAPLRIEQ